MMNHKLMAAGHEACKSDRFALETLESRTFLSGSYAMPGVGGDVAVGAATTSRQQVMEARPHQERHHLESGAFRAGRVEPTLQMRVFELRSVRMIVRHFSVGFELMMERGWSGGRIGFPPGGQFEPPAPKFEPPIYPEPSAGEAVSAGASETPPPASGTASRNVAVLSNTPSSEVAAQDDLASAEVVVIPDAQLQGLSLGARAVEVVSEVSATMIAAAAKQVGEVGKLQSALVTGAMVIPSSQAMRWLAPDAGSGSALTALEVQTSPRPQGSQAQAPFVQRLASMVMPARVFDFARFGDPLAMLCDPLAAFADESAASSLLSKTLASPTTSAWSVTAAVVAVDVVLLTYFSRRGRRGHQVIRGRDIALQTS